MADENQINNQPPQVENQPEPVDPQNTPSSNEGIISTIVQHKKLVLFFIIGFIALLSVIVISTNSTQPTTSNQNPTIVPPTPFEESIPTDTKPTEIVPTDVGLQELPTPTPNESKEATEIKTQAKPQIDKYAATAYDISRVKIYQNIWALIQISNPNSDPANALLKKENGSWKLILGPGTYFSPEQLEAIGAPQEIKTVINTAAF